MLKNWIFRVDVNFYTILKSFNPSVYWMVSQATSNFQGSQIEATRAVTLGRYSISDFFFQLFFRNINKQTPNLRLSKSAFLIFFLHKDFLSQTVAIYRAVGEGRVHLYSSLPLPPTHEYSAIYLQLCMWDWYQVFSKASHVNWDWRN